MQASTIDPSCQQRLLTRAMSAHVPCCFVKQHPFTTEGNMMPMILPCGCTMSFAASRAAALSQSCQLCNAEIPSDAECLIDRAALRVLQAERRGISVPAIHRSRITLGEELGQGAQGRVHEAELADEEGDNRRSVAVKVVSVPAAVESQDVGALEQVIATTCLASQSPHVCKMHGVSWTDKDAWCGPHLRALVCIKLQKPSRLFV